MRMISVIKYVGFVLAVFVSSLSLADTPPITPLSPDTSPDRVMINYTAQVTDKTPGARKTVTIINNTANIIYPVFRTYGLEDPKNPNDNTNAEFRLYVAHWNNPADTTKDEPVLGIPANGKVDIILPIQLWNAGRIIFLTNKPEIPTNLGGEPAIKIVDRIPNSPNSGNILFRGSTALGFPLDTRSQLAEYTIETDNRGAQDFHIVSDRHVVDYDISYVDEMYLPIAMEVNSGTMGYVGSGISIDDMQNALRSYTKGEYTQGYFDNDSTSDLGWPLFKVADSTAYDANYVKIPAAYNIFALSDLYDVRSSLDPAHFYMLQTNLTSSNPDQKGLIGGDSAVTNGLLNRWLGWVTSFVGEIPAGVAPYAGYYAKTCTQDSNPEFCKAFADTVNYVWRSAVKALPNATPAVILQNIIGYTGPFNAGFNAYDPTIDPPIFNKDQAFRDAVKSLLRGVPYPFDNYDAETQWYPSPNNTLDNKAPNPNQKYNLDPMVWFVHKKLQMSGYGFSIDDDTANIEAPGNGFIVAIGGLGGLPNTSPYAPNAQQALLAGPGWQEITMTNFGKCPLPPTSGADCPLSLNPQNNIKSTDVSMVTSDKSLLTFTLGYNPKPIKNSVYPLVMTAGSCKVTGSLDKNICTALNVDPNKPQFFIVPAPGSSGGGPTPPPVGPGNNSGTLYLSSDWGSVSSDCTLIGQGAPTPLNPAAIGGTPGAIVFSSQSSGCTIKMQGAKDTAGDFTNITTTLAITFNADNSLGATCTTNGGECNAKPNVGGTIINMPPAGAMVSR